VDDGSKSPRLASRVRLLEQILKPIDEVVSVGVIFENRPPLDSTNEIVLQCSGASIPACRGMMNKFQI
jgi:hypothetical protein